MVQNHQPDQDQHHGPASTAGPVPGVTIEYDGDQPTVGVAGRVDRDTITEVSGTVRGLVAVGVGELVVDLTDAYEGAGLLAVLARTRAELADQGGTLRVAGLALPEFMPAVTAARSTRCSWSTTRSVTTLSRRSAGAVVTRRLDESALGPAAPRRRHPRSGRRSRRRRRGDRGHRGRGVVTGGRRPARGARTHRHRHRRPSRASPDLPTAEVAPEGAELFPPIPVPRAPGACSPPVR